MVFFLSIVFFMLIVFTAGKLPRADGGDFGEGRVKKASGRRVSSGAENLERARRMVAERLREISAKKTGGAPADGELPDFAEGEEPELDVDLDPDEAASYDEPSADGECGEYSEMPQTSAEQPRPDDCIFARLRAAEAEAARARIAKLDAEKEAARIATAATGGADMERAEGAGEFSDGARIREILSSKEGLAAAFVCAEILSPCAALEDKPFCDKPLT